MKQTTNQNTNRDSLKLGLALEEKVAKHFQRKNFDIIQRNFRSKLGEIDLIAQEKTHSNQNPSQPLLFIEVRYRRSMEYGSAAESIDFKKQQKIIRTAEFFLKRYPHYQKYPCRFDVIAIQDLKLPNNCSNNRPHDHHPSLSDFKFEWIQNAFQA